MPADAFFRQRSGNDELERGVTGEDVEVDVGVQDGDTGLDGGGDEAVDESAYGFPLPRGCSEIVGAFAGRLLRGDCGSSSPAIGGDEWFQVWIVRSCQGGQSSQGTIRRSVLLRRTSWR